eukprot:gene10301-17258_t
MASDLSRSKLEDALSRKLQYRPTKDEVVQRNILRDAVKDPKVQATLDGMARQSLQLQLSQQLEHRPGPLDLVHNGLMQAPGVGAQVMLQRQPTPAGAMNSPAASRASWGATAGAGPPVVPPAPPLPTQSPSSPMTTEQPATPRVRRPSLYTIHAPDGKLIAAPNMVSATPTPRAAPAAAATAAAAAAARAAAAGGGMLTGPESPPSIAIPGMHAVPPHQSTAGCMVARPAAVVPAPTRPILARERDRMSLEDVLQGVSHSHIVEQQLRSQAEMVDSYGDAGASASFFGLDAVADVGGGMDIAMDPVLAQLGPAAAVKTQVQQQLVAVQKRTILPMRDIRKRVIAQQPEQNKSALQRELMLVHGQGGFRLQPVVKSGKTNPGAAPKQTKMKFRYHEYKFPPEKKTKKKASGRNSSKGMRKKVGLKPPSGHQATLMQQQEQWLRLQSWAEQNNATGSGGSPANSGRSGGSPTQMQPSSQMQHSFSTASSPGSTFSPTFLEQQVAPSAAMQQQQHEEAAQSIASQFQFTPQLTRQRAATYAGASSTAAQAAAQAARAAALQQPMQFGGFTSSKPQQ